MVLVSGLLYLVQGSSTVRPHCSTAECFLLVTEVNAGVTACFSAPQPCVGTAQRVDLHRARRNTHARTSIVAVCLQRFERKVGVELLGPVVTLFNRPGKPLHHLPGWLWRSSLPPAACSGSHFFPHPFTTDLIITIVTVTTITTVTTTLVGI